MTEVVAESTGEPPATVRLVSRALLDADVLPKASGRRIPQVAGRDVAALIFGIYGSEKVRTAAAAASLYSDLRHNGAYAPPGAPDRFKEEIAAAPRAVSTLAQIIDGLMLRNPRLPMIDAPDGEHEVGMADVFVEICQSWPEVAFAFRINGRLEHLRFVEAGKNAGYWQSDKPRRTVTIPGVCLSNIAIRLMEIDGEG
jgi:hypothetical protein